MSFEQLKLLSVYAVQRGDYFFRRALELRQSSLEESDDFELKEAVGESLQYYQKAANNDPFNVEILGKEALAALMSGEYRLMWQLVDRVIQLRPHDRDGYLLRVSCLLQMEYVQDAIETLKKGLQAVGSDVLMERGLELLEEVQECRAGHSCHLVERGWHSLKMMEFLHNYLREKQTARSLSRVMQSSDAIVYMSLLLRVNLLSPSTLYEDNLCPDASLSPLHVACWHGNQEVVQKLLSEGSDPNESGYLGLTPMHMAGVKGDREVMKVLIKYGGELSLSDPGLNVVEFAMSANLSFWNNLTYLP